MNRCATIIALLLASELTWAQSRPQAADKAAAAVKAREPATVEQAALVLDLRTFPLLPGAKVGGHLSLGMLLYEAKGRAQAAFDFQRQELVKRGFKELPGGYSSQETCTGNFTKDGFVVAASASDLSSDPAKTGWASVSLVNSGNVALDKLPVPPGARPFYPTPTQASYTTAARPAETAAACRKLLLAAGWEPYGQADHQEQERFYGMQYFKRNAIKLQSWISTTPAEGGKTLIRYDAELMSADLPAPPDIADPRYDDLNKKLDFDAPQEQTAAILAFYEQRLPKQGWQATTAKPVVDERRKTQFLVFRNPQKELLALDLTQFTGIVRVRLKHQTAAELAEEERLAKAEAEQQRLAEARRNRKVNVALPLPAKAANLEKTEANLLEFTLATGGGPAALEAFRAHFRKEGWTEAPGAELNKNVGEVNFKKGEAELRCSYFDIGFGDAEIRISGSKNVVLEPLASQDKP